MPHFCARLDLHPVATIHFTNKAVTQLEKARVIQKLEVWIDNLFQLSLNKNQLVDMYLVVQDLLLNAKVPNWAAELKDLAKDAYIACKHAEIHCIKRDFDAIIENACAWGDFFVLVFPTRRPPGFRFPVFLDGEDAVRCLRGETGIRIEIHHDGSGYREYDTESTSFMSGRCIWTASQQEKQRYDISLLEKLVTAEAVKDLERVDRIKGISESADRAAIPQDVRRAVWARDQQSCRQCGARIDLEFDHILPVSKGGSNSMDNIQILCRKCNRHKSSSI